MKEIVAIVVKDTIYYGLSAIAVVQLNGGYDELVDRDIARFMACADLGSKWNKLANAPTLFTIDEKGNPKPGPEFKEYYHDKYS